MAGKGPGRSHREGLTVIELLRMFPDDAAAERWFEEQRWPEGRFCPDCGSTNTVAVKNRKPMPYRCRDCRHHFSVRKGTVMQSSNLGLQKWAIALYMTATGIKGTASMKVYREIGMRQATAWHLMHRIRESFDRGVGLPFPGPVEIDETKIGGKFKNMHRDKRHEARQKANLGKATVAGIRDRETARIVVDVIQKANRPTLRRFLMDHVAPTAIVYHDDARAYMHIPPFRHEAVNHSAGEYVRGQVHTNGMESFWSLLKRGINGTFHHLSEKHLHRYINEFAGRHNMRDLDTVAQMSALVRGMVGKRLRYRDLVAG